MLPVQSPAALNSLSAGGSVYFSSSESGMMGMDAIVLYKASATPVA
jgi:hypothetical protein